MSKLQTLDAYPNLWYLCTFLTDLSLLVSIALITELHRLYFFPVRESKVDGGKFSFLTDIAISGCRAPVYVQDCREVTWIPAKSAIIQQIHFNVSMNKFDKQSAMVSLFFLYQKVKNTGVP